MKRRIPDWVWRHVFAMLFAAVAMALAAAALMDVYLTKAHAYGQAMAPRYERAPDLHTFDY